MTGAVTGDRVRDEWYDPDGNLYRSANWNPLPSSGYRCFWDSIFLANSQAAARPGRWTINVYYNDNFFFSLDFHLNIANLREQVVARTLGEGNQCRTPTPVSLLLTTDQQAWVWFNVSDALPGDTAYIEWYEPNGNLYTTQRWGPPGITWTGSGCFWTSLAIANSPLATKVGLWRVRVFYNQGPLFTTTFTIAQPSYGGTVVIDGTDANEHGHVEGGKNQEGWLYMQRVLESLAAHVPLSATKVIVDLGTDETTDSRSAIDSAFNLSSLPGAGWRLTHVNGSSNINSWLINLSLTNTGILYIPTYNNWVGDLSAGEMGAINSRATNIARFFTGNGNAAQGGAVFAMAETDTATGQGAWQWLQALFPGIGITDYGTAGVSTEIKLTLNGANTLAGLTNADLADVHPWHNSFSQLQGRLKVLGTAPDADGNIRQVILGGEARDLIVQPCILTCAAQAPTEAVAGAPAGTFTAAHTLSDCTGAPIIAWDFGNGQRSSSAAVRPTYVAPGTYNWTLTVNAANASTCTRTGQVTVRENCAAPSIISNPRSTVLARGRTATLSVLAGGNPPLRYQWYAGARGDTSLPVSGATLSTFTTPTLNVSTSYWVRVSNSCGARDVPTADSGEALVTVTDPLALTVEAVDPACKGLFDCQGDYLDMPSGVVLPNANRNRLMEANVFRTGVVADGVTLLLLRVRSDVPVTFSVPAADLPNRGILLKMDGTLGDLNGQQVVAPAETTSKGKVAFAIYRAPIDRLRTQVAINAISSRGGGSVNLKLYYPPVVLVHGVWSDSQAWLGLDKHLRELEFDVFGLVDYGSLENQSAGSFDPKASNPADQIVIGTVNTAIEYALEQMRKTRNVAATQVDVVGHSMGGLVARARVKSSFPTPYERKNNYNKGDFHKLITVGTPHQGSPLADWLAENKCHQVAFIPNSTLHAAFSLFNRPLDRAVFEFQTAGNALQNIGQTRVPSHAIVGLAPEDSDTERNLNVARQLSFILTPSIDDLLGKNGPHDTIVPATHQRGGLSGDAVTEKPWDIVHAAFEPIESRIEGPLFQNPDDISETASTKVWDRVIELLRAPTLSSSFGFLPALNPGGKFTAFKECQSANLISTRAVKEASATITPMPGSRVRPGEVVQVHFNAMGGGLIDGALFAINSRLLRIDGNGPFTFSFAAPTSKAGRLDIKGFAFGSGETNALAFTHLIVESAGSLTRLSVTPNNLSFTRTGGYFQLRVTGQFTDGTTLDLSSNTAGTTYVTQSRTNNVVSISPDGALQIRGLGQEVVLIANSGKTASVNVFVAPSGEPPETKLASVSAASFLGDALAPESIVAAFGVNLATSTAIASSTPLPTRLAGASVTVRDSVGAERLAPLFFVSPGQINFQIPSGTATGAATITVNKDQGFPAVSSVLIEAVAPAFFSANSSGQGVAAAVALRVRADGSQSYEPVARYDAASQQFVSIPLDFGPPSDQLYLILFGIGLRFNSGLPSVAVQFGGVHANIIYAGPQGDFVGLDQINLLAPRSLAGRGEVDITLSVDGRTANTVKVNFR